MKDCACLARKYISLHALRRWSLSALAGEARMRLARGAPRDGDKGAPRPRDRMRAPWVAHGRARVAMFDPRAQFCFRHLCCAL
eukprot:6187987-Pleurochrysis_carterae.AAC.7